MAAESHEATAADAPGSTAAQLKCMCLLFNASSIFVSLLRTSRFQWVAKPLLGQREVTRKGEMKSKRRTWRGDAGLGQYGKILKHVLCYCTVQSAVFFVEREYKYGL